MFFNKITKATKALFYGKKNHLPNQNGQGNQQDQKPKKIDQARNSSISKYQQVSKSLKDNENFFQNILGINTGIITRSFTIGQSATKEALLIAVGGMAEKAILNQNVLRPLMKYKTEDKNSINLENLKQSVLSLADLEYADNLYAIANNLFDGKVYVFLEGEDKAIEIDDSAWAVRAIQESITETTIRGPRDAFNEDLMTNVTLLRRRISSPNLRCEKMYIGKQTNTRVVIVYIEGIVHQQILKEVYRRLDNINIDSVLESGYIEQLIEDAPLSFFPTVGNHERPDTVAAQLLEGRIAIIVDGTPFVLTVPYLLINHFQVSEDYYSRPYYSNLVRLLRVASFFITVMTPGIFVAIQYYHPIFIPFSLLVKFFITRANVPFQLYIETIGMLFVFEIIRESGLRMPKPIGQAVSLVGALILGEAAVQAGLVGIPVVVVVAIVGISSFPVNSLSEAVSILRILFVIAGTTLGLFGILILGMVITSHLASMRSFGVPYTEPIMPIRIEDWKDGIIRFPLWLLKRRPAGYGSPNANRQKLGGKSGAGSRGKS